MTIAEFKAWLEGYSANMGIAPTAEQWKAIKAKIATINCGISPTYAPYRKRDKWWENDQTVPLDFPSVTWSENKYPLRAH